MPPGLGLGLLDRMNDSVPIEISEQLSQALDTIGRHLSPALLAIHLYGSAVDGGLKPHSDIDLLVTVAARPDEAVRRALMLDLLKISAPPGQAQALRPLEVTVVVKEDIVPWRPPARRELQFGEWLRADLLAGVFDAAVMDPDLAILITKARQHGIALLGPPAEDFFAPVAKADLLKAMAGALQLWNSPADWTGDEPGEARNVVLTLVRIWYSAVTGNIVPKDVAAEWAMNRLPAGHQSLLHEARDAYLGRCEDRLFLREAPLADFILSVKREAAEALARAR